jgi:Transposase DDE domain
MRRPDVIAWVLSVTAGLRRSQAKTLAELTAAAMHLGRATLAALGRRLAGETTAKHRIKRAWRFCANERVEVSAAMAGVIDRLTRRRKKPLLVALDWVEVTDFHTLMAAAVRRGRAVPLLWASYPEGVLFRSQNSLEEGLLRLLRSLVPAGVRVIVLADRGFGRAELAKTCRDIGVSFVFRIKPEVRVRHPRYRGRLDDYPIRPGCWRTLKQAEYRSDGAVTVNVAIRWKKGLPPKRNEPWFLITDLDRNAVAVSDLYAQRMTVEELFRDGKSCRNGSALRLTQLTRADRLDRLLLVLALAYILLTGLGAIARARYRPGVWCSSNDERQCSVYTIGRVMLDRMDESPEAAWRAVVAATNETVPKWG